MNDEQSFRALLDDAGLLREGALAAPARHAAFAVFAQRTDAALDVAALQRHAARFFGVKIGLTVDKRYDAGAPAIDAARVVIAGSHAAGTRLCFGRPATEEDREATDAADTAGTGMAILARRCGAVWLVATSEEADGDRAALTIAAVLASVLLGPILPPRGDALYGVKTARLKLEGYET
jgi:hypothetical protein